MPGFEQEMVEKECRVEAGVAVVHHFVVDREELRARVDEEVFWRPVAMGERSELGAALFDCRREEALEVGMTQGRSAVVGIETELIEEIGEIVQLTRSGKRPCTRVMDLAKARLADVDEQMRRLAGFRTQLVAEISRWEAPVDSGCDGMCQMIDSSRPEPGAEFPERGLKVRKGRKTT